MRIYDRSSNNDPFELKTELITTSDRYLDTDCEQQDRYFYLVEIVDIFGRTFHSDDQHPSFGSCLQYENNENFEKLYSVWDLMKQIMAESLADHFPLLTDETVSALLELLEMENDLKFVWIEEFPLYAHPDIEPIIGDIRSALFHEEIFESIIEQEKTYRNRFLLTPFEWNEKIKELYLTAEDR